MATSYETLGLKTSRERKLQTRTSKKLQTKTRKNKLVEKENYKPKQVKT